MIKVTFKEPVKVFQDGAYAECLHVYAFSSLYNYTPNKRAIWLSDREFFIVKEDLIAKVEAVKANEF